MSLVWAVNDKCFEPAFHEHLEQFKASIVRVSVDSGEYIKKPECMELSDYLTSSEATKKGWIFEKERVALIRSKKISAPREWIRGRRRSNIELFHITPARAKTTLKKTYPEAFQ